MVLSDTFYNTTYDLLNPNDRKNIHDLHEKVKETLERAEMIKSTITAETTGIVENVSKSVPQIEMKIEKEIQDILGAANF